MAELLDHLEIISLELARSAREYKNKIIAKIDLKESVDEAFGTLTHEEKTIIRLRYWDFPEPKWHWDKIVKESYYCQSQCFEIHKRAINKMNEQIKKPSWLRALTYLIKLLISSAVEIMSWAWCKIKASLQNLTSSGLSK